MTPPVERFLASRGLRETDPQILNSAFAAVLDRMEPLTYGDAPGGLPAAEQAVLRAGGLNLEPQPGSDPLAMAAVKYAAIVARSLTSRQVGERLGLAGGRVRQLIADRFPCVSCEHHLGSSATTCCDREDGNGRRGDGRAPPRYG